MKLVADSGAWTVGPPVSDAPAVAVLEVSGAVLAWTVDDPRGVAATRLAITDVVAAEWLWRVVGPGGHAAIAAVGELAEFDLRPDVFEPLRRLAIGHWLRRWWPESLRDGIVPLDHALLDGELAVLTDSAQDFFTGDTLDSDVEGLLAPHRRALVALERGGDPRVVEMVRACVDLGDETGAWSDPETMTPEPPSDERHRVDYALAAGPQTGSTSGAIAHGVGSVDWVAVPPGTFDAADDTIDWAISAADASVLATVRVAMAGGFPARGIAVRLRSGSVHAAGVLDAGGTAAVTLVGGDDRPLTEDQAWDHDWSTTTVSIGADVTAATEPDVARAIRQRLRAFARDRLSHPGADAFLAEIVAAESDY